MTAALVFACLALAVVLWFIGFACGVMARRYGGGMVVDESVDLPPIGPSMAPPPPEARQDLQLVAKCPAHGHEACPLCSLNPGTCAVEGGSPGCGYYLATGMHWDTCPNRVLTRADAEARGLLP